MAFQGKNNNFVAGNTSSSMERGSDRDFLYTLMPVLPSQILESYSTSPPPSHIFSEALPDTIGTELIGQVQGAVTSSAPHINDPAFAATANDLINRILNRTPTDDSVVDPDSVIGESLRLYHGYKDGKYLVPNDAAEQDRLDLQHMLFRILYDGWLSLAPLSKAPTYVLDIGTGTGLWAFEFGKLSDPHSIPRLIQRAAEQNPSSHVIGVDLSAIQPTNRSIPNCEFVKADIEDEWIFSQPNPDHQKCAETGHCEHKIMFDYIHLRLMFSCFEDPRTVMKCAFDNMTSGGWIEFQETSFDVYQGNPSFYGDAFQRWAAGCLKGAAAVGRDLSWIYKYKQWLEEIGFVDVTERKFLLTCGEWPTDSKLKLVGRYCLQDMLEGIRGIGYKMLRLAGMTTEEVETLINQCASELKHPQSQTYWYSYVFYGRKP
ncbi:S-adenosyl-L-methionine-dependent methyltransferase [Xylariales sp. PMI_506]|nr:S-adenosyl-L-methionine-dependent methyltransferase [Xylariales sp. PMI_506]